MKEPWELAWRDYYRELGVADHAGEADLQAAFRALARVHHPDAQVGRAPAQAAEAERRFKLVVEAYEVLRDPARRAAYDDARCHSVDGRAPLLDVTVEPEAMRIFSWNGDIVLRSHLTMPGGAAASLVAVECDDPRAELISVDLAACAHGRERVSDAVVRARLATARPHALHLEYAAGSARATQTVRVTVLPVPPLWVTRLQARSGWAAFLAVTAVLTFLLAPLGRALAGDAGVIAVAAAGSAQMLYALAVTSWAITHKPRWWRVRPRIRGGWGWIAVIFIAINVVRLIGIALS